MQCGWMDCIQIALDHMTFTSVKAPKTHWCWIHFYLKPKWLQLPHNTDLFKVKHNLRYSSIFIHFKNPQFIRNILLLFSLSLSQVSGGDEYINNMQIQLNYHFNSSFISSFISVWIKAHWWHRCGHIMCFWSPQLCQDWNMFIKYVFMSIGQLTGQKDLGFLE